MDKETKLKRNIKLFYYSQFFSALLFIIPVWVTYQRQFLTFTQMSMITGLRFFLAFLMELPTGAFADLFGRKTSVVLGFTIQTIALIITALAPNGLYIGLALILLGIGEAFQSGADLAIIYDSLKALNLEKTFTKVRSNAILITQIGIIISSIAAGYFFGISKSLPYYGEAIALILAGICYILMYEEKLASKRHIGELIAQTKLGVREVFRVGFTRNLSIFYILVGGITWSWQIYFNQIFASGIGYSEIGKGWLFAIIRFVNAILILRVLHFEKYLTKRNMFLFFPIIMLFSSIPAIFPSKEFGTLLLFTMTLASTMRFVVLDGYVNEVFESHYRATALSTLNMFVRLIYILAVTLSGPLLDHFPAGVTYFLMGIATLVFIFPGGIKLSAHKPETTVSSSTEDGLAKEYIEEKTTD